MPENKNRDLKDAIVIMGIITVLTILLLTIPIFIFWLNFVDFEISKEPKKWGVFGDYIGGAAGTL